jgi:hypothetical protein
MEAIAGRLCRAERPSRALPSLSPFMSRPIGKSSRGDESERGFYFRPASSRIAPSAARPLTGG